jgi:hypothetical protein
VAFDADLLTISETGFHLLGEDSSGGKAPDELLARLATLIAASLIGQNCGDEVFIAPGGCAALIAIGQNVDVVRDAALPRVLRAADLGAIGGRTEGCFHDGDRDFDQVTVIEPSRPTRAFWQRQLDVALDDLAHLVAPREVVICEGNPAAPVKEKNAEHDAICYDTIFSDEYPDVKFLSAGNAADVARDRLAFLTAMPKIATGITVRQLIDRDDHAPADVARFNADGISVLSRRNIESYLFDDEMLAALCQQEGRQADLPAVIAAKKLAIANSIARGNPRDDLKSAAGDIFNSTRQILHLVGCGNDHRAFARSTLAPLVRPGTATYDELKHAIFGKRGD